MEEFKRRRKIKRPVSVPCKEHWPRMGKGCDKCRVMELEDWAEEESNKPKGRMR